MAQIRNISAVMFDMDGTLVDSELMTEPVIRAFCREAGIPVPDFDWPEFYGVKWMQVAARLAVESTSLDIRDSARRLHELWERMCEDSPPAPVPGAVETIEKASADMPTAIVSSAYRESIDATVRRMGISAWVTCRVGADDYGRSKPAPDGFLHAASLLQVRPETCLVFEDSLAGLQSARAAGMKVVAVTHRSNAGSRASELADLAIDDYTRLEADFFERIRGAAPPKSPSG